MSLIDEALKRAQAARSESEKQEQEGRPWTPAPLPDRRRLAYGRFRSIAAVTLVAAVAVAAVLLLRRARTTKAVEARSAASLGVSASSAALGLPPITSEVTVAPPPGNPSSPAAGIEHNRTASTPAPTLLHRSAASAAGSSAPSGLSLPGARPSAPTEARPEAVPKSSEARTYAGEMPLPGGGKITLDGIAFSETSPVAVLNGKVLAPGGYVEGFTVVKILPDHVELEAQGAKAFLTLR